MRNAKVQTRRAKQEADVRRHLETILAGFEYQAPDNLVGSFEAHKTHQMKLGASIETRYVTVSKRKRIGYEIRVE